MDENVNKSIHDAVNDRNRPGFTDVQHVVRADLLQEFGAVTLRVINRISVENNY